METTTLADISPFPDGPDLMAEPDPRPYSRRENIRWPRMGGVFDWSAREWSLLIAAAAIAVLLIWFFLFGGISMFSGTSRDVKKAGSTMESDSGKPGKCSLATHSQHARPRERAHAACPGP